jgi:TP901 family phage tail tape measure protein
VAGAKFNLKFLLDATDHASSVFGKVEGRGKRMGNALAGVGGALTAGITTPVLAAGMASTKFAIDFWKSLANISTRIDTDKESLSGLSDAVLATSRKLKGAVELNELPTALYEIRSAGVSATDQLMVLERSAKLGAAGLGTTNEAVDLVTSSLNAFELKGKAAERVYDNIFATVNLGKTTISGLAQGFGATAGTVAAAGIELDEYLSSVAALTTTGQPASQVKSTS